MISNSILRCPVCGEVLDFSLKYDSAGNARPQTYKCIENHSFDAAKEGYVNLLLPSKNSPSKDHGDNKLMIDARRAFLDAGYYAPFCDTVSALAAKYREAGSPLIDIGCGEGYYTVPFVKGGPVVGVDISKHAVRYAAKRLCAVYPSALGDGGLSLVCGSANSLPVIDSSCGMAVNLFAPLEIPELCRVVKPGGYFIYAVPTPKHLFGLKEILYEDPYENTERQDGYDGFEFVERVRCEVKLEVKREHIMPLFMMTPYYYRTPEDGVKRLEAAEVLVTDAGMDFLVYVRKD